MHDSLADSGASLSPDGAALDRSFVRAIAWVGSVKWGIQVLTWISTLLVARLLRPEDYGLMGMAVVFTGFVTLLSDFGLGASIVILRDLERARVSQLNGLALALGVVCAGISCLLAAPVADFYASPEVRGIILTLSAMFVISAFRSVPRALLERDRRFRALALLDGAQSAVGALVTIALALAGLGYWALVLGQVANAIVATALALVLRPHPIAWPREIHAAVRLSSHIAVGRLAWYFYSRADFLIAGKFLGSAALGHYSFAFTLASIPLDKITAIVTSVTPSFLAAVQKDPDRLRRTFLNVTEGLALLTFPVTWGTALVAGDLVELALGEKWLAMVVPLQLLSFYASFRCVTTLLPQILNLTGHSRFAMNVGLLSALVLPLGFYYGSAWGPVGIAAAWLYLHPLLSLPNYWRVLGMLQLRPTRYLRALWPALSASLLMAAAVWAIQRSPVQTWPVALRLGLQVAAGAAVYASALLLLHRERSRAAFDALKRARD
jgi:O-antigen/teichoic acid export membrane protein